ncbi:MAG: SpoIIE family protein phosphatase [Pelovirga sp.]
MMQNVTTAMVTTSHILIVEDDPGTSRIIQKILERQGFRTCCAFTRAETMVKIGSLSFDLILLDISLPDGNGFDICSALQQVPRVAGTPVIYISSHSETDTKIRAFEAGGVDYITKPVAGAELIARVTTHLRLRRAYEQLAELQAERVQRLAGAQSAIMPGSKTYPDARFEVVLHQALEAGGDFYDVVPVGEDFFDYIVADASGHDLAASFWTAALKTLITENAHPINHPRDICLAVNKSLRRILPQGVFFTMSYVRVNRRSQVATLVSAAHPPVIVMPADGSPAYCVEQQGDILGVFDEVVFDSCDLQLAAGDRLLLYSDGLIEIETNHETGSAELLAHLATVSQGTALKTLVNDTVRTLSSTKKIHDDILLLGVEL